MGSETLDSYASVAPKAQREILIHSVLAGLTPLIPLPFADDWARNSIQTRMVQKIADAHEKTLYAADTKSLGKETGRDESIVFSAAKKLAFFPVKRILRTAVFVLVVKDIVDVASRTYHVGYLLDHFIGQEWPTAAPAASVRARIDDVCRHVDTSPVRRVFLSVFEESKDLLELAAQSVKARMGSASRVADAGPDDGQRPREVEDLADRLQRALNVLPPKHFLDLRLKFEEALGIHEMKPEPNEHGHEHGHEHESTVPRAAQSRDRP